MKQTTAISQKPYKEILMEQNNIHDKVFTCPKCHNKTLVPVWVGSPVGIGYDELCICEECGAELYARPQFDFTVQFSDMPSWEEDDIATV